jgi:TRAP-type C4-dicarboxylate transport system permease small subunit
MGVIGGLSKKLKTFEEISILILMIVILTLVFADVVLRYGLNKSLTWSEEVSRFLFVAVTYVGASAGVRTKGHIIVDLVIEIFPKTTMSIAIISNALAALFCLALFIASLRAAYFLKSIGQTSAGLSMPMWIPYMGVILGSCMICFRFVEMCLYTISEKDQKRN